MSSSSSSSDESEGQVGNIENESTLPKPKESSPNGKKKRSRGRGSKKNIPDYDWTPHAIQTVADYIKDKPQLYDKKQKEWLNITAKIQLWAEAGALLEPPATGKCSL